MSLSDIDLVETPDRAEEGRSRIESLLENFDEEEVPEQTALEPYKRVFDTYILAPIRIGWDDWRTRIGLLIVGFYVFMGVVWAPRVSRIYLNVAPREVRPFNWQYTNEFFGIEIWKYPLGTTQDGRPLLMRIVRATPDMLMLVLAGSVVSIGLAVLIGTAAGYKGGSIDTVLMGITDVVMTIPGLPLVILISAILRPEDPFILGMILAIDNWPGLARSLRSQVLTIRRESYVEASRTMGISLSSILMVDIIPQLMPYIVINAATAGKKVIVEAVALYFLGFLEASRGNWGRMIDTAYQYGAVTDLDRFYLVLFPMVALSGLAFGLVLLGQGLDKVFNPRLRARHSKRVGGEEDEGQADPTAE